MTKKSQINNDTIAALATAAGQSAISIVRLSGDCAVEISKQIFRSKENLETIQPRRVLVGKIYDGNAEIDEVVVIKYQSPHSYTTEDMIEINCHGGVYVSQKILELLVKFGARIAMPGEFTLRAFLNGRLDLAQAEAVADIIKSRTEFSLRTSVNQLSGKLSENIFSIRNMLLDSCSLLELELDFSEEDVEFLDRVEFLKKLDQTKNEIEELLSTFNAGRIAREGVKLVIVGKPNVGKSSLLNLLANEDRAIVTEIPGTTRDSLEVQLDLKGIWFRIFDTAGIKFSTDPIEAEGIKRSKAHLNSADIILHLFDGSLPLEEDDFSIINRIEKLEQKKIIRVVNKADLPRKIDYVKLFSDSVKNMSISVLTKSGINELEKTIVDMAQENSDLSFEQTLISNVRHWEALNNCLKNITNATRELENKTSAEFVAVFLRDALDDLGQIIGITTSEEILNNIFAKFCIGK